MHPPLIDTTPDDESPEGDMHDRRCAPGRRTTDFEHEVVASALVAVKSGWKHRAVIALVAGAIGSGFTTLLLLFGLKIGGAADLSTLKSDVLRRDSATRADVLRRDSALERWRTRTDSVTTANGLRIARLESSDELTLQVMCSIADQLGAKTGNACRANPLTRTTP